MEPQKTSGILSFRTKNSRKSVYVSIEDCMALAFGDATLRLSESTSKSARPVLDRLDADLIDLSDVESRIMVNGDPLLTADVRGLLFQLMRDIREERRDDLGLAPIGRSYKRKSKRTAKIAEEILEDE